MENDIETADAKGVREQRLVRPCADCGNPSTGVLLMNTQIIGSYEYLCADCLEENDPDGVMQEPCSHCRGSGREWEGWDCEYCDGTGTDDL